MDRVNDLAQRVPGEFEGALDGVDDWDGSVSDVRARLLPALTQHAERVRRGLARR